MKSIALCSFNPGDDAGLDIGLWQPLARGGQWIRKSTGPPKNPLAPQKHVMTQMFSRREFMISRVKLHTFVHYYITKNKYELTLPSEFCIHRWSLSALRSVECGSVNKDAVCWFESVCAWTLCCFMSVECFRTRLELIHANVCAFPRIIIGNPFIELNIAHKALSIKQPSW